MADASETVIIRIQLDPSAEIKKMEALTLELEKNRDNQKELNAARKAGQLTDEEYAKRQVELKGVISALQKEYAASARNVDAFQKSNALAAGSVDQLKAQLATSTAAYNALSEAEREGSEAGKLLAQDTLRINEQLKTAGATIGDYRRNVGDYAGQLKGSFEDVVQQLVKLQEQQKNLGEGSQEAAEGQHKIVGFMTAAQQAAAKQGKSYEQATSDIENYSQAIQPTVQNLVKLELEQARLVEQGEETTETYRKIGFQIAAANKTLEDSAKATKQEAGALDAVRTIGGPAGEVVSRLTDAKQKYTAAAQLAKAATLAEVTSLGALKLALIATGIGAFVVILGSLITFLTKTQTGIDYLERKTKGLGIVVGVLTDKVSAVGQALFEAFDHPKQAASDLVDFIGTNLLNRLKAFGVIVDGIVNRDPRKIADGFLQVGTGIADATGKAQAFTNQLSEAAKAGNEIAAESQRILKAEREVSEQREKSKAQIEALKLIEQDTSKSTIERLKAGREAFELEEKSAGRQQQLQKQKVANIEREQALTNNLNADNDKLTEERNKLYAQERDSNTRRIELNNQLNAIQKAASDKEKADAKAAADAAAKAAEARLAARRAELKLQNDLLDQQLRAVEVGSDKELNLLQQKLTNQRAIELAQKNLTLGQKQLLDQKYEADSTQLLEETLKKRAAIQIDNARSELNARLAAAKEGSQEELALRQQAIEQELAQQLASLDKRKDNAAKEKELRAQAAKQLADTEFTAALAGLEAELQARRQLINQQYAEQKLTKRQQEDALTAIDKAGLQARLVAQQDYGRDTAALQAQIAEREAAARDKQVQDVKDATDKRRAYEDARLQSASEVTDGIISLFREESTIGQAALAIKKTLALAEIAINLQRELSAIAAAAAANPANVITAGVAGISQSTILSGLAIAKAALLAAKVLVFRRGGLTYDPDGHIADGPSHEQGGIPLYSRRTGRRIGIEVEGGEPVLTAQVSRTPHLLAAASAINVAAGGRPLIGQLPQIPAFAVGGLAINNVYTRTAARGDVPYIDYSEMGKQVANALRKQPPIIQTTTIQDAQRVQGRTDSRSGA